MSLRALLSVYDKQGLEAFARGLSELGFELVASGGTAEHLTGHGLEVTPVDELTDVPALLEGRVKTLHPSIHAAILARRDRPGDLATLEEHGIEPFDLVCVNFYPFAGVVARHGVREEDAVEMIDIGGPAMLRAAAKNFGHVIAVCRPERYDAVLEELRDGGGGLAEEARRELAAEAFAVTACYEASIAAWFGDRQSFPQMLIPSFEKTLDLAYGENPHQRAAYYAEVGARRHLLSMVEQLHGRQLSLVNLYDLSAGRLLLREFTVPACALVKHANPCGVAVAATIEEAYDRALACDPVSAFGVVCVVNRPVTAALAERLAERFVDVLFAPGYEEGALDTLRAKEGTRILVDNERRRFSAGEKDYRRVLGGLLVQDRDWDVEERESMQVVCGSPSETLWGDLLFAWRACKHVSSNAIVLARDLATIGIGGGQTSRVDAVRLAVDKARLHGHELDGSVLASDAFFPFPDGPQAALEAGVAAVIQPGGSKRDPDVIAAVERAGAVMVFTGRRHFRH
ncbi:MAG: bifunctional phosphoribosylaminoimidazolecarboxamide formyltransferase/IMP cyclohydrolase [Gaiellaceae bacterium]